MNGVLYWILILLRYVNVKRHEMRLYSDGCLVFLGGPGLTEAGWSILFSDRFCHFNVKHFNAFKRHPTNFKCVELLLLKNSSLFFARDTYH